VAHRRQINRGPSPVRLAFQIARTTISPNYPGEVFEILVHEVLVVSADVPPQDGETDEQRIERENANAARATRRQQELAVAAPAAGQHVGNIGQGASNQPAATSGHKHLQLQQLLNNATNLAKTACVPETS
jgi:hypothetical protein